MSRNDTLEATSTCQELDCAEWPRVLVMAHNPFTQHHSNGHTLSSLFAGWPKDRLAQVYAPFAYPIAPMFDVCSRYWAVTPRGLETVADVQPGAPRHADWPTARRLAQLARDSEVSLRGAHTLRELLYWPHVVFRGSCWKAIQEFRPQLIFSSLGTWTMARLVRSASAMLGAPIVPFFTDDWLHSDSRRMYFQSTLRRHLLSDIRAILNQAPTGMAISEAMAKEYSTEFGVPFMAFTLAVEATRFNPSPLPCSDDPLRFVYAGNVTANRWQNLVRLGDVLATADLGSTRAELIIHTSEEQAREYGPRLFSSRSIRYGGNVSNAMLPSVYRDAHVLVHVESFDQHWAQYTRLSLSTKITEYMMAARPILAFGPGTSNSIRYVEECHAGIAVYDDRAETLAEAVRQLSHDRARRAELGMRGRAIAMERHEARRERERFKRALLSA